MSRLDDAAYGIGTGESRLHVTALTGARVRVQITGPRSTIFTLPIASLPYEDRLDSGERGPAFSFDWAFAHDNCDSYGYALDDVGNLEVDLRDSRSVCVRHLHRLCTTAVFCRYDVRAGRGAHDDVGQRVVGGMWIDNANRAGQRYRDSSASLKWRKLDRGLVFAFLHRVAAWRITTNPDVDESANRNLDAVR